MGSRRSNPSVKPGQKNPIDSNTIRSSSLRDYTARACPLRQLQNPRGGVGAAVSTARVAYDASSSEAVTAVTDYSSSSPLFFGQPAKCDAVHTSPPIRP